MNQEQIIYRAGCWGCKRAQEDPKEKYICPKKKEHLIEWKKQEFK